MVSTGNGIVATQLGLSTTLVATDYFTHGEWWWGPIGVGIAFYGLTDCWVRRYSKNHLGITERIYDGLRNCFS